VGPKIGEWFIPRFNCFWVWPSSRYRGQSCCRFFCARLAPADGARVGTRRLHFTKRQFSRFTAGLRSKVREGHSDESNALRRFEKHPAGPPCLAQFGALPSLFPIERRKKDAEILRFGPSVGRGPIPRQHSDPARVFDLMLAKTGSIRPVPPEPHGLVADVDPALGQQILDIAQRQRISHVHHHNQTDDLWRAVDISERICSLRRLTQPGQPANLL
jgi:hypothetical protein